MVIEILFPEFCNLFGDSANVRYMQQCLPEAEFVETSYMDEPYFVKNKPDLIYMGATTEHHQEMIIEKLMPYRARLKALIEADVPMLFTNNALEVLGKYIQNEDGSRIKALGLYPIRAKRDMMHRFNCLLKGSYKGMTILGFKTQFTFAYGETEAYPFIQVEKGTGMNKKCKVEGIHDHNLFATYLVGPFLILNPAFTQYLFKEVCGLKDFKLAYEDLMFKAFDRRLIEFNDPKCEYE